MCLHVSGPFGFFEAVGGRVRRYSGGTARGGSLYMHSGCGKTHFMCMYVYARVTGPKVIKAKNDAIIAITSPQQ